MIQLIFHALAREGFQTSGINRVVDKNANHRRASRGREMKFMEPPGNPIVAGRLLEIAPVIRLRIVESGRDHRCPMNDRATIVMLAGSGHFFV